MTTLPAALCSAPQGPHRAGEGAGAPAACCCFLGLPVWCSSSGGTPQGQGAQGRPPMEPRSEPRCHFTGRCAGGPGGKGSWEEKTL